MASTPQFRITPEMLHTLFEPRSLLLVAANLLPVLGVLLVGWDVFVLIMLYWLETAIIGFWTFVGIIRAPRTSFGSINGKPVDIPSRPLLALFILVHAGIFMGVHYVFVWSIFGQGWVSRVSGPAELLTVMVIPTGVWIPLAALFFTRGLGVLAVPTTALDGRLVIAGLYVRIVVLHLTIIFGAMLSLLIHSVIGLVLLIVLKTLADLFMGPLLDYVMSHLQAAERRKAGGN
ncbi:hypothetical protein SAMN02983003_3342 [Devosia enhydra]|uniref:Uncharacterized protein n=1 Tax=Devosia enhydra TaxID=665118 RepID=A0A1K2I1G3_9HYPH|nr:DUF6498-containing protein [Devosia enhydra]SFZ86168.1 hypothetical protein SAMN02983003_3342 [Devosia enhydra]